MHADVRGRNLLIVIDNQPQEEIKNLMNKSEREEGTTNILFSSLLEAKLFFDTQSDHLAKQNTKILRILYHDGEKDQGKAVIKELKELPFKVNIFYA